MTVTTSYKKFVYQICLSPMKLLRVEKGCQVAILFVYMSLVTVMSSKLNVENSMKAQNVDETHSYRFLKFEINKSNQKNNVKSW